MSFQLLEKNQMHLFPLNIITSEVFNTTILPTKYINYLIINLSLLQKEPN